MSSDYAYRRRSPGPGKAEGDSILGVVSDESESDESCAAAMMLLRGIPPYVDASVFAPCSGEYAGSAAGFRAVETVTACAAGPGQAVSAMLVVHIASNACVCMCRPACVTPVCAWMCACVCARVRRYILVETE